jgi:hypothetical protein
LDILVSKIRGSTGNNDREGLMRRSMLILAVTAVLVVAIVPAFAGAQTSEGTIAALAELEAAVDGLGGESVEDWVTSAAAVDTTLEALRGVAGDELDFAEFDTAVAGLNAAVEGGDLDEIAAAALLVEEEIVALAAQVDDGSTTTTAAPAGGVATGAGGMADTNAFPISVLAGAGLVSLLLAGLYTQRRRSEG